MQKNLVKVVIHTIIIINLEDQIRRSTPKNREWFLMFFRRQLFASYSVAYKQKRTLTLEKNCLILSFSRTEPN